MKLNTPSSRKKRKKKKKKKGGKNSNQNTIRANAAIYIFHIVINARDAAARNLRTIIAVIIEGQFLLVW